MDRFIARNRILQLRLIVVFCLPLVVITRHPWSEGGFTDLLLESLGEVLLFAGVLGRIWATLYIAGRKNERLVTIGPYSICRNPLYLFTALIGAGLLCMFGSLLLVPPVVALFAFTYALTIRKEECFLAERFGEEYAAYAREVPRFLPAVWKYRPDKPGAPPTFEPRLVLRGILDTGVFLLLIPLAEFIEGLHVSGVLPVLLRI